MDRIILFQLKIAALYKARAELQIALNTYYGKDEQEEYAVICGMLQTLDELIKEQ